MPVLYGSDNVDEETALVRRIVAPPRPTARGSNKRVWIGTSVALLSAGAAFVALSSSSQDAFHSVASPASQSLLQTAIQASDEDSAFQLLDTNSDGLVTEEEFLIRLQARRDTVLGELAGSKLDAALVASITEEVNETYEKEAKCVSDIFEKSQGQQGMDEKSFEFVHPMINEMCADGSSVVAIDAPTTSDGIISGGASDTKVGGLTKTPTIEGDDDVKGPVTTTQAPAEIAGSDATGAASTLTPSTDEAPSGEEGTATDTSTTTPPSDAESSDEGEAGATAPDATTTEPANGLTSSNGGDVETTDAPAATTTTSATESISSDAGDADTSAPEPEETTVAPSSDVTSSGEGTSETTTTPTTDAPVDDTTSSGEENGGTTTAPAATTEAPVDDTTSSSEGTTETTTAPTTADTTTASAQGDPSPASSVSTTGSSAAETTTDTDTQAPASETDAPSGPIATASDVSSAASDTTAQASTEDKTTEASGSAPVDATTIPETHDDGDAVVTNMPIVGHPGYEPSDPTMPPSEETGEAGVVTDLPIVGLPGYEPTDPAMPPTTEDVESTTSPSATDAPKPPQVTESHLDATSEPLPPTPVIKDELKKIDKVTKSDADGDSSAAAALMDVLLKSFNESDTTDFGSGSTVGTLVPPISNKGKSPERQHFEQTLSDHFKKELEEHEQELRFAHLQVKKHKFMVELVQECISIAGHRFEVDHSYSFDAATAWIAVKCLELPAILRHTVHD
ncbi:hypothetical protein Poli38472_010371 [Pythium oligandrum]|uniref:EF-hand domain-containing protein n=1 Tax=Pythium oligandrum TaxID=41045 RepID=A0A8K1C316_PYTOL|nr:hypothetical protein Poli38472_010371 [Pythium oligandrum]|eukprot:TMW55489.1 hypothetical protein Poli38472_010371 [Pythium oligandrum]